MAARHWGVGGGAENRGRDRGRGLGAMQRPGASASTAQARRTSRPATRQARTETMDPSTGTGSCGWMVGGSCCGQSRRDQRESEEGKCGQEPISENRPHAPPPKHSESTKLTLLGSQSGVIHLYTVGH